MAKLIFWYNYKRLLLTTKYIDDNMDFSAENCVNGCYPIMVDSPV